MPNPRNFPLAEFANFLRVCLGSGFLESRARQEAEKPVMSVARDRFLTVAALLRSLPKHPLGVQQEIPVSAEGFSTHSEKYNLPARWRSKPPPPRSKLLPETNCRAAADRGITGRAACRRATFGCDQQVGCLRWTSRLRRSELRIRVEIGDRI